MHSSDNCRSKYLSVLCWFTTTMFCANLAFVQSKLLHKLKVDLSRRCVENQRSRGGFHASATRFHWNHRCFKCSNCERTFTRGNRGKRQIFSRNHSRFQRTSNREKLTLKFSTICSSLFLIRKSGFSIACAEELLICFPFCISYFVRGGNWK